ncbi:hypothetical protein FZEAL_7678 [Fusarium zealandicum]|uniref:Rhodopsin domain-containing protein n=1 Tax=Fusarium zealandicum TaxID=1053134 RepID=A0A8H4UG78_9HYPO|nr:hypothetical protein FZEAL_7678 [Fusarium zealandicum]
MTGLLPNVYAAVIIPMPAAALALALRLKVRRMTKMGIGWDDGLAIAAWGSHHQIIAVAYSVLQLISSTGASNYKLGQRLEPYDDAQVDFYLERSRLILWVSEYFYAWSIGLAKLAVLAFYRRQFQFCSIRIPTIIMIVACALWMILRTFLTTFHCLPVPAYWDKSIQNARCMTNVGQFFLATDVTHCLMDFIILALPIYEVFKMQLPFGQKIAVIGLFASGSLVCIASIFQIIESQRYHPTSKEMPYELALSMIWGNVEVHLAVFASCLALLRPIFRKFVPGLSSGNSYATSRPTVTFGDLTQVRSEPRVIPGIGSFKMSLAPQTSH